MTLWVRAAIVSAAVAALPLPAHAQKAEEVYNEGTQLLAQGKVDQAIARFMQALQLKPDLAAAHFNLGTAYERKGALVEAIAAYRGAIEDKPEGRYYLSLGLVYKKKGMVDEAIDAYLKAAEASPTDARVFYNLGNACLQNNRLPEAVANYEKALRLKYPTPAAVHLNMGIARQKQGDNAAAIAAYKAYLAAAPEANNARQIRQTIDGLSSKGVR
jgi:protein O-GlcNAc transferase